MVSHLENLEHLEFSSKEDVIDYVGCYNCVKVIEKNIKMEDIVSYFIKSIIDNNDIEYTDSFPFIIDYCYDFTDYEFSIIQNKFCECSYFAYIFAKKVKRADVNYCFTSCVNLLKTTNGTGVILDIIRFIKSVPDLNFDLVKDLVSYLKSINFDNGYIKKINEYIIESAIG